MSESIPIVVADTATVVVPGDGAAPATRPAPRAMPPTPTPPPAEKRGLPWKRLIFLAILLVAAGVFTAVRGVARAKEEALYAVRTVYHKIAGTKKAPLPEPAPLKAPASTWDGLVPISKDSREAMGMRVVPVETQVNAVLLEVTGTTDYDQNTLAKIRPLFDARVSHVFKSVGEMVKKGDPLVEIYSTTLAAAKIDFRSRYAQWIHDKNFVDSRRELVRTNAISQVQFLDTYLAEITSRVAYFGARDRLITYGISLDELERLQAHIDQHPNPKDPASDSMKEQNETKDEVHDISKLILKAPIDGMIVERDCVAGNFYDDMAVVMVISPMDKLWVWGDVYEKDQADVHLGQKWDVWFPNLDMKVGGTIEHIAARFDANTRTLKIRASIPNPNSKLKADQRVRATLEIPAQPGQTVIPRNALVVINGEYACFVQSAQHPDKFRRQPIEIDQENHDIVVVRRGLSPNEKVVTNGSLILSQLYEDESTVSTGQPLQ
jgi:membrane fusion protein, heavy metal efflux system